MVYFVCENLHKESKIMNNPEQKDENSGEEVSHRQRIRYDWNNLIEDIIAEGRERGLFDNLKGKGKPLDLHKNHFAGDKDLAHSLLKENDIAPAWIMQRNDILAAQAKLRTEIAGQWAWYEQSFRLATDQRERGRLTIGWDDACRRWQAQIEELNKNTRSYNLKRPSDNLELFQLKLETELERIGAQRWLR
jgi:hypothetical protein